MTKERGPEGLTVKKLENEILTDGPETDSTDVAVSDEVRKVLEAALGRAIKDSVGR